MIFDLVEGFSAALAARQLLTADATPVIIPIALPVEPGWLRRPCVQAAMAASASGMAV